MKLKFQKPENVIAGRSLKKWGGLYAKSAR